MNQKHSRTFQSTNLLREHTILILCFIPSSCRIFAILNRCYEIFVFDPQFMLNKSLLQTNEELEGEQQHLKLKRQKRRNLIILSSFGVIILTLVILTVVFVVKQNNILQQTITINSQIQQINNQIQTLKLNRTLNLSNCNLKNISLSMSGSKAKIKNLILQNNLLEYTGVLSLPYLQTLDLTNNHIVQITHLNVPALTNLQISQVITALRNSTFGFKQLPQSFSKISIIDNSTFTNLKTFSLNNSPCLSSFVNSNLPLLQVFSLNNSIIKNINFDSLPNLLKVYLSTNLTSVQNIQIGISSLTKFQIDLTLTGTVYLVLSNARLVDFNRLNISNLIRFDFKNTEVINFNRIFESLQAATLTNITGFSTFDTRYTPNLQILKSNSTPLQKLYFQPDSIFALTQIKIQNSHLTKIQNINTNNSPMLAFYNNPSLISFVNNSLPNCNTFALSQSVQKILHNDFRTLYQFYTNQQKHTKNTPNLSVISYNNFESMRNLVLNYTSLGEISQNIFSSVQHIYLQNSFITDDNIETLLTTNMWTEAIVVYINLTGNPIDNIQNAKLLIKQKFPNISIDI